MEIQITEIATQELLDELHQLEAKFGMTSKQFWAKWQTPEGNIELDCSPDGFQYNSWAILYGLAKRLGLA